MIDAPKHRRPLLTVLLSLLVIAANFALAMYYWWEGALDPSDTIIQKYAIAQSDPSACRLSYSPLRCLHTLANPESITWSLGFVGVDTTALTSAIRQCSPIGDANLRILCTCSRDSSCTPELCQHIENRGAFADCITEAATTQKDPNICRAILDPPGILSLWPPTRRDWRNTIVESCSLQAKKSMSVDQGSSPIPNRETLVPL